MTIILFIVVLAILILTHEIGHFLTAKWAKIRVDEFGLGLPPRIWGIKRGETIYSINWLPLGGFVKIFGEDPSEENTIGPDSDRSFVNRPKWVQVIVLAAGVTLNLVLAWLLLTINLGVGMPVGLDGLPKGLKVRNESLAIVSVVRDSPAARAGLVVGDQLISLSSSGQKISDLSSEDVHDFTKKFPNQVVEVDYLRNGKESTIRVTPLKGVVGEEAAIGIATQKIGLVSASWWQAPLYSLFFLFQLIASTLIAFGYFFANIFTTGREALGSIAGPIGIYSLVSDASRLGLVYLLNFVALISVNLAVLNLLPFPALDGGRILFSIIEAIIRRPIKPIIANTLNTIGFFLLIGLMFVIAVSDVSKLF